MDLGEFAFKWWSRHSKKKVRQHFLSLCQLDLQSLEGANYLERLELLCRALSQESSRVSIFLSDSIEFPSTHTLFLPRRLALGISLDQNYVVYWYRLAVFQQCLWSQTYIPTGFRSKESALIESANQAPHLHVDLLKRYSGFADILAQIEQIATQTVKLFIAFDPNFRPWGELIYQSLGVSGTEKHKKSLKELVKIFNPDWLQFSECPLHLITILPEKLEQQAELNPNTDLQPQAQSATRNDSKNEPKADSKALIKTVAKPEVKKLNQEEENPLTHVFEKLLTAEEHKGGTKQQDGADETDLHADALAELTLDSVAASATTAEKNLKSKIQLLTQSPEIFGDPNQTVEVAFQYPEWFEDSRRYNPGFCTVYESTLQPEPDNSTAPETDDYKLIEKLSLFLNESRWKPRQKDGPEFDLDALVRLRSQLHGSGSVDQRLYVGRKHLERDLAILILIDSSLSTDGWIENRRVIDVIKTSIQSISGAFNEFGDLFSIAAFNSHSRKRCNFKWIKKFNEPWVFGKNRIQNLKPEGYTRIGPALRHSHTILKQTKARRKLLLLFSDAKPSDYDRYEGEHGLNDVKKAVTELKSSQIFMKALAVTGENRSQLARLFGSGQYQVLNDPSQIANQILEIFTKLMH